MSDKKEMQLDDKFTFGKYKGVTVRQLIRFDRSYLEWCIEEDIILLSNEAFDEYTR
jgi:uncharacterized protein (DUF3820 family)